MSLAQTVIVVTGTASGLGRAMASAFVDEGASVVCADVDEERLDGAMEEIEPGPGRASSAIVDVRSPGEVADLMAAARERFGPIDVLVNNVGIRQWHVTEGGRRHPIAEVPVDAWDAVIETNLRGTFLCTRAVLPEMLERGAGRLIHLSSGQGTRGAARKAPYVVTKFGIEGFHESLSLELEDTGVASMTLRPPGSVHTEVKADAGLTSTFDDPSIVAGPAVELAAGAGENGGRYLVGEDGETFTEYSRA